MTELRDAFDRVIGHESFNGSRVCLERDRTDLYIRIAPDWIDAVGLRFVVDLARELELSVALTECGLRLDSQSGRTVRAVQMVKDVLADSDDG